MRTINHNNLLPNKWSYSAARLLSRQSSFKYLKKKCSSMLLRLPKRKAHKLIYTNKILGTTRDGWYKKLPD